MAFLSLGRINKNIIPVIIGCIFCFLNRLLNQYKGTKLFENPVLTNIYISSSKLLGIIPLIISKIRSKSKIDSTNVVFFENNDTRNSTITATMIRNIDKKEKKHFIIKGKWALIFLTSIIFFFNQFLYVLTIKIKSNTTIFNILITSIFYYIILKNKLYRHHYVSVVLIIIIGVTIDLILGNLQVDANNNLLLLLLRFPREILYSLSCVIDKYIMEKKFGTVYELIVANGIINLVILLIFAIFDYNFGWLDNYNDYFNNFNSTELLVALGVIITQFGLNLFILISNKSNSPCHIFIIFIFGQLSFYLNFSGISILILFFLLIILFCSCIFNEIIELNFCGLSENTKRNIIIRAQMEEEDMLNDKNNIYDIMVDGKEEFSIKDEHFMPKELEEKEDNEEKEENDENEENMRF